MKAFIRLELWLSTLINLSSLFIRARADGSDKSASKIFFAALKTESITINSSTILPSFDSAFVSVSTADAKASPPEPTAPAA